MGARGLHQRLRHRRTWRPSSPRTRPRRRRDARSCTEESKYFLSRAHALRATCSTRRSASSRAATPTAPCKPPDASTRADWGGDYTETDGWNFAFHAPQDGQGLANLYGGRDGAREEARHVLRDARDGDASPAATAASSTRCSRRATSGWASSGMSNQVVAPHPVHVRLRRPAVRRRPEKVREILRRLYVGSEIGQGYPGDEDNGEMSAWYVLCLARASTRCRSARPTRPSARRSSSRSTVKRTQGDLVVNAPGQHRDEHLRAGRHRQRHEAQERLDQPGRAHRPDHGRLRDGCQAVRLRLPRPGRPAVADAGHRGADSRSRTRPAPAAAPRRRPTSRRATTPRRSSTTRRAPRWPSPRARRR